MSARKSLDEIMNAAEKAFGVLAKMSVICVNGHRSHATIESIRARGVRCPACAEIVRAFAVSKEQGT